MRTLRRLRLRSLTAMLFLAPLAQAQVPLEPQGIPPATAPRQPVERSRLIGYTPPTQTSTPGVLPADIIKPTITVTPKREITLTKFDPLATEVRHEGRRWQIWANETKLKDFGDNRNAAYEARRLIAELKLSERGAIGTPDAVMEYWLTSGHAPPLPSSSRNIVPFEAKALRVIDDHGVYFVGDDLRRLYNFGPHAEEAEQALQVIRKYEFNELGLVGTPEPGMTYLLKNDNAMHYRKAGFGNGNEADTLPQMAPRYPLDVPGLGRVGERRPFDPMRIEVRHGSDGWHLVSGPHDFGSAGSTEYQARTAMQIAQRYPLTEHVRLGKGDFGFYLSNGQAPRGAPLGVRRNLFEPKSLTAKQAGNAWVVGDGRQTLGGFANAEEANLAIKVIQHYGFNCICESGAGLRYLAQDH